MCHLKLYNLEILSKKLVNIFFNKLLYEQLASHDEFDINEDTIIHKAVGILRSKCTKQNNQHGKREIFLLITSP